MHEGKVREEGTPEQMFAKPQSSELKNFLAYEGK